MKTSEELYDEVDQTPFDVCDWGSCQYSLALGMFRKLEEISLEEGGDVEKTLTRF